jgi:hypothetical protein
MTEEKKREWSEAASLAAGRLAIAARSVLLAQDHAFRDLRAALQEYDREMVDMNREDVTVQKMEDALVGKKSCNNCDHLGADPDGPYCAHHVVLKDHPMGLNPVKALDRYCNDPLNGEPTLWTIRVVR